MAGGMQGVGHKRAAGRAAPRRAFDCLTDWARAWGGILLAPVVRVMAALRVHPNTVTLFGMLLQVAVGVVFGLGYFRWGGASLLIVAPVDALDGALARALGTKGRFGAFLDSTADRVSDSALILGMMVHYLNQGAHLEVLLLLVSLVAALLVSYTRARAEALGFTCKVGILTRLERILLIGIFTLIGLPEILLWLLALLSLITVAQRVIHIYAIARQEDV